MLKSPEKSAEQENDYWQGIKEIVEDKIEEILLDSYRRKGYSQEEIEEDFREDKETMVKREKKFLRGVISLADSLMGEKEKGVLLFDIDETLGEGVYTRNGKSQTILRPTAEIAFRFLKNKYPGLELGILTTRNKNHLLEQIKDGNHLKLLDNFLSYKHLYSTEEVGFSSGPETESEIKNYLGGHPLVPSEDSNNFSFNDYRWTEADFKKMEILKNISEKWENIGAVDDLDYPKLIKFGFSLYPDAIFII